MWYNFMVEGKGIFYSLTQGCYLSGKSLPSTRSEPDDNSLVCKVEGDMKLIPLTQGKFTQVDDEDYEYINQWKWQYVGKYVMRSKRVCGKVIHILLSHLLITVPKDKQVDHKDRNPLNNCKSNLRLCTYTENNQNRAVQKCSISGYKGVYWEKNSNAWRAHIQLNGKKQWLGYYESVEEATHVYDKKAIELFGEFA
jgi:hypothetical protein